VSSESFEVGFFYTCAGRTLPQRKGRRLGNKYLILISSKSKILYTSLHYVNSWLWRAMRWSL